MSQVFARRHAYDGLLWAGLLLYALVIILVGFSNPVERRIFDEAQAPAAWPLVIHVWSFCAWMCLLAIQAWCAATKRIDWHRRSGLAMLPLAAVMIWSAETSEIASVIRGIAAGRMSNFMAISVTYVATFSVFVVAAWIYRTTPPTHKRLILLATASIMGGAHSRAVMHFWPEVWSPSDFAVVLPLWFGGTWIIAGIGMAYDHATRGIFHPVYRITVLPLLATHVLAAWLYTSPAFDAWLRPIMTAWA